MWRIYGHQWNILAEIRLITFCMQNELCDTFKGILIMKMFFRQNVTADPVVGYADADWAGDKNDRNSTSGYVFKVFGNTISCSTRRLSKQPFNYRGDVHYLISKCLRSYVASEFIARAWHKLWKTDNDIWRRNQSCIKIAEEPREHKRTKHICCQV